jgi:PHS family inorganic phosphate transporter-like MFS transporter
MQIFALFMFLGMLTSMLVPEGKGARLEELSGEKDDVYELQFRSGFFRDGREKGRPGAVMEHRAGRGRGDGGKWWKLG